VDSTLPLEERLEQGELVYWPACPFALPAGDDLHFLFRQALAGRRHKNISFEPHTNKASGAHWQGKENSRRLERLLANFADTATGWLGRALPRYAAAWRRDRASYRPDEEATRCLRLHARNDLLHIDAFPSRPTHGARLLRLFANINLSEPRVWATSETFPRLLERFGRAVGLPAAGGPGWARRVGRSVLRLVDPRPPRPLYDEFMLQLHNHMKQDEYFQEKGPRRFWSFAAGSAWLAFTDSVSHAVLRGRFALEHTFFVPVQSMVDPSQSPATLFERACGLPLSRAAA
jgi:hypothetical protein